MAVEAHRLSSATGELRALLGERLSAAMRTLDPCERRPRDPAGPADAVSGDAETHPVDVLHRSRKSIANRSQQPARGYGDRVKVKRRVCAAINRRAKLTLADPFSLSINHQQRRPLIGNVRDYDQPIRRRAAGHKSLGARYQKAGLTVFERRSHRLRRPLPTMPRHRFCKRKRRPPLASKHGRVELITLFVVVCQAQNSRS